MGPAPLPLPGAQAPLGAGPGAGPTGVRVGQGPGPALQRCTHAAALPSRRSQPPRPASLSPPPSCWRANRLPPPLFPGEWRMMMPRIDQIKADVTQARANQPSRVNQPPPPPPPKSPFPAPPPFSTAGRSSRANRFNAQDARTRAPPGRIEPPHPNPPTPLPRTAPLPWRRAHSAPRPHWGLAGGGARGRGAA